MIPVAGGMDDPFWGPLNGGITATSTAAAAGESAHNIVFTGTHTALRTSHDAGVAPPWCASARSSWGPSESRCRCCTTSASSSSSGSPCESSGAAVGRPGVAGLPTEAASAQKQVVLSLGAGRRPNGWRVSAVRTWTCELCASAIPWHRDIAKPYAGTTRARFLAGRQILRHSQ